MASAALQVADSRQRRPPRWVACAMPPPAPLDGRAAARSPPMIITKYFAGIGKTKYSRSAGAGNTARRRAGCRRRRPRRRSSASSTADRRTRTGASDSSSVVTAAPTPRDEVELHEVPAAPHPFQLDAEHPQREHVEQDVEDPAVQEHVRDGLPERELLERRLRAAGRAAA